jgi:hypothetical protein
MCFEAHIRLFLSHKSNCVYFVIHNRFFDE